jgi:hypothetical protein
MSLTVSAARLLAAASAALLLSGTLAACGGSDGNDPILQHCPRHEPREPESASPGSDGDTVPEDPTTALICRWSGPGSTVDPVKRSERRVRGAGLASLVKALNSLPPGKEGEVACPSGGPLIYLIAIRYGGASEVRILARYHSCDTAFNLNDQTYYDASFDLEREMNKLLGG